MNEKMMKLMEILEQISEEFPELDKVIINDPDNPDYIILATTEYLNQAAEMFGISEEFEEVAWEEGIAEEYPDIPKKKKYRGPLQ